MGDCSLVPSRTCGEGDIPDVYSQTEDVPTEGRAPGEGELGVPFRGRAVVMA
jgi:hypothetical protein